MAKGEGCFWAAGERGRARRIEDYGLIGDSETAVLVSRTGSIDWLCWPRFDSEACMAALLCDVGNGYWRIAPAGAVTKTHRRYRGDTLILETTFETETGAVRLIDLMPLRGEASDLVRIVEGVGGRVAMRSMLDLRFEYGRLRPLLRRVSDHEVAALAGPHAVVLHGGGSMRIEDSAVCCDFEVAEGERASFVLTYYPSHHDEPKAVDPEEALRATEDYWSEWAAKCDYEGPYRDIVVRSLVTLKALTYRPTGGIAAAATTSLPETPGGERNWDYRYCWVRDAALVLLALVHAGYKEEGAAWRDWLLRALAGEPGDIRPLYRIDGDRGIREYEADWLSGFNGATPVRIGNAAHLQLQLDLFGEVLDAFHLAREHGLDHDHESRELQRRLLLALEDKWREPDAGFWEVRSDPQHFVHSKAMAWAAFDRGVRSFGEWGGEDGAVARWAKLRDEVRAEVMEKGFSKEKNSFTRAYGSDDLDANTLLLPLMGFVHPCDPEAIGTVAAIERELMRDGLVDRYDPSVAEDGLPGCEGAFLACSFWLADNYHLQGRTDEARALFEKLTGLANDLGLMSEEYDPKEKRMLGNFPQALSHVALVNCAYNLSRAKGPAEDRLSLHEDKEEAP
ncbi:MAG: glycoside hydrolase family 15 protein [Allosphingosinicella sp.]